MTDSRCSAVSEDGASSRHARQDLLEHLRFIAEPLVAERTGALADHLGDLGLERTRERLGEQRDDVVGFVEIGGEPLGFDPCAHRVR